MIKVEKLSVSYPSNKENSLNDITFSVEKGEIFGFLGPSGSGKSTLQRVLTGILSNYEGSVKIFDDEVSLTGSSFYERIGVVFEFPNFYGKFTAVENLTYFSSLYNNKKLDANKLLDSVGLLNDANKKVDDFSKGMKMRLAFIRSIMHRPELLFLDEPTSGLDPINSRVLKKTYFRTKKTG